MKSTMVSATLRETVTKFVLVPLLICLSGLLTTDGQLRPPLIGRQRTCPPHTPLPVNDNYDVSQCRKEVAAARQLKDQEAEKRTPQIVIEHGYDLENHTVTSEDGYILSLFRVPGGSKSPTGGRKPAVLLYHGLSSVSDSWFIQPSDKNFVFMMVDAGYDVWISNGRGSDFSQGHESLDAEKDIDYWDFSFHEMGVFDLPATVDLILKETGNEKIFYIGHSEGGTIYLVGASEIPELNDKIHASILLAPAAYLGHAYIQAVVRLLPILYTPLETILSSVLRGYLDLRNPRALSFFGIEPIEVCSMRALQCDLCNNIFFSYFDLNPNQANYTNTANLSKYPNTGSVKSFIHFGQNILSCQFRKYDYGTTENLRRYGSREPPSYSLENLRAPLHLFYGEQDPMITPLDITLLANDINPEVLRGVHRVEDDTFEHLDFAIARDADKLVYSVVIDMMNVYVNNSTGS